MIPPEQIAADEKLCEWLKTGMSLQDSIEAANRLPVYIAEVKALMVQLAKAREIIAVKDEGIRRAIKWRTDMPGLPREKIEAANLLLKRHLLKAGDAEDKRLYTLLDLMLDALAEEPKVRRMQANLQMTRVSSSVFRNHGIEHDEFGTCASCGCIPVSDHIPDPGKKVAPDPSGYADESEWQLEAGAIVGESGRDGSMVVASGDPDADGDYWCIYTDGLMVLPGRSAKIIRPAVPEKGDTIRHKDGGIGFIYLAWKHGKELMVQWRETCGGVPLECLPRTSYKIVHKAKLPKVEKT